MPPTATAALPRRGCRAIGAAAASPFPAGRGVATTPRRRRLLLPAPGMEGRGGPGSASPGAAPRPSPPGPLPTPGSPLTRGWGERAPPSTGSPRDRHAVQPIVVQRCWPGSPMAARSSCSTGAVGICSRAKGRACGSRGGRLRVPADNAAHGWDPAAEGRTFSAGSAHGIPVILFERVLGGFCRLWSTDGWR